MESNLEAHNESTVVFALHNQDTESNTAPSVDHQSSDIGVTDSPVNHAPHGLYTVNGPYSSGLENNYDSTFLNAVTLQPVHSFHLLIG